MSALFLFTKPTEETERRRVCVKLFHLSDLHIGKRLNGYSLGESQRDALGQVLGYAEAEKPDVVMICGDIYDKSLPSGEAYTMFDWFLTELSDRCPEADILIISGNHDSPERLAYGASFLERHRIHIATRVPTEPEKYLMQVTRSDEWGKVHFYLVPFFRPGQVRNLCSDPVGKEDVNGAFLDNLSEEVEQTSESGGAGKRYTEAFRALLNRETIREDERNVILAHQFFVWNGQKPETCDSETAVLTSGGLDAIDAAVLKTFDYAALGHIHGAQKVGEERFRYCGTPYKYSVSEEHHQKGITVVEMGEKGSGLQIRRLPLVCHPEVRRLRGTLEELKFQSLKMGKENEGKGRVADYVSVTLTDEREAYDFRERLEALFSHILEIRIDNARTRRRLEEEPEASETLTLFQAFRVFYEAVRHAPLTQEQEAILTRMVEETEEEERES